MRILILLLLTLPCLHATAHQFMPTEARLTLVSEEEFVLTVDLDLIELMQQAHNLKGNASSLIEQVRDLSASQIKTGLQKQRQQVLQDLSFNLNGNEGTSGKLKPEKFALPPESYVMRMLAEPPENTEYRIAGISRARISNNPLNLTLSFPESWGPVKLTVIRTASILVSPGTESLPISLTAQSKPGALTLFGNYIYQGFLHIIPKGLDHILFVLAMFLFAKTARDLIVQITLFTLAHSFTLILASYQLISVPGNIVEPLIAISIAFVALENLLNKRVLPWRMTVIFTFGLLHGLGFASVLMDLGLPNELQFLSLFSFNIGVEVGQLAVVAIAYILLKPIINKDWYRKVIIVPGSTIIAMVAMFWTFERLYA